MKARSELDVVWQSITSDIDILITHGPPKGILDVTLDIESREPTHVGSRSLRLQVLDRIKPQIHAFGHIHDEKAIVNFGSVVREGVQFINCSCCDIGGRFKNNGMLIEIEPRIHEV
jgi:Icc-related predicted phosphoesterase